MKGIHLNKSFQINANFNNLIKNLEQKDEALFSRKSFLEIILGLIKEALMDLLNKTESKKNKEKKKQQICKYRRYNTRRKF